MKEYYIKGLTPEKLRSENPTKEELLEETITSIKWYDKTVSFNTFLLDENGRDTITRCYDYQNLISHYDFFKSKPDFRAFAFPVDFLNGMKDISWGMDVEVYEDYCIFIKNEKWNDRNYKILKKAKAFYMIFNILFHTSFTLFMVMVIITMMSSFL